MSDGDWWESWLMLSLLLFFFLNICTLISCVVKNQKLSRNLKYIWKKTCEIAVEQSFNEKWNRAVISVWGHQTSIISLLGSNITIRCAFFLLELRRHLFFLLFERWCVRESFFSPGQDVGQMFLGCVKMKKISTLACKSSRWPTSSPST